MRITKEEIVAGHSAVQIRGLLKRFDGMFFTRTAVERVMRLKPEQAEKLINEMVLLELIEPIMPFDNHGGSRAGLLAYASLKGCCLPRWAGWRISSVHLFSALTVTG